YNEVFVEAGLQNQSCRPGIIVFLQRSSRVIPTIKISFQGNSFRVLIERFISISERQFKAFKNRNFVLLTAVKHREEGYGLAIFKISDFNRSTHIIKTVHCIFRKDNTIYFGSIFKIIE